MTTTDGLRRRPTGARAARIHDAVLTAAAELLTEGGLSAATADAVAARAGVSKATIYNHWPSRLALASEAFGRLLGIEVPAVDNGSLVEDVAFHMSGFSRFLAGPLGHVYAQLLAASVEDEAGATYFHAYFLEPRRELLSRSFDAAVARGEVAVGVGLDDCIDMLVGPLVYRRLVGRTALTPEGAARIARLALEGILATPHHPRGTTPR